MSLIARCPTLATHKRFHTTAHVTQLWEVDEKGSFIACDQTLQTDHGPDPANVWTCMTCGEEATVTVNMGTS